MKKTIRLLAAKLLVAGLIIVQVLPAFAAGNSLVGWQWIMGADGKYHCYYLNPFHNGSYGACLLNTITPDGYTVNANGEWTVNGVVQSK